MDVDDIYDEDEDLYAPDSAAPPEGTSAKSATDATAGTVDAGQAGKAGEQLKERGEDDDDDNDDDGADSDSQDSVGCQPYADSMAWREDSGNSSRR